MMNFEDNVYSVLSSAPAWPAGRFDIRCSLFSVLFNNRTELQKVINEQGSSRYQKTGV